MYFLDTPNSYHSQGAHHLEQRRNTVDIREIEKRIDILHKTHLVFSGSKKQLSYELLCSFEDLCSISVLCSILNPFALGKINGYFDAINQALIWVENSDLFEDDLQINTIIPEYRYKLCTSFLDEYAYPYTVICSGYMAYSRERMIANVDNNVVTFDYPTGPNVSEINDILREANQFSFTDFLSHISIASISEANEQLKRSVRIEDGQLCYALTSEIVDRFIRLATEQWNMTKTLPDSWQFDLFSLAEYRQFWINLAALCYIHFFSCLSIQDPDIRLQNSIIILPVNQLCGTVASLSGIGNETVRRIVNYITFNPKKRNADIMYQPIINHNEEQLLIAPMLVIGSRPERNLLALVSSSNNDHKHSKEVNDLEELMVQEIESTIPESPNVTVVKHKNLGDRLPDVDFGILDTNTNTVLICELKWFTAADSSREVFAREDDITHGCDQVEAIMTYAMMDRKHFIKQLFDYDDGGDVDIYCCVVARHNIRTMHKYVPVIDLERFKELLSSVPLITMFNMIRNHEYEAPMPENVSLVHKTIKYGDYTFKIPAVCFEA